MLDLILSVATEVFGRPAKPTDDFFGLGADSMLIVTFLSTLEQRTGQEYDLQSLIDAEDFADLAARLSPAA